MIHSEILGQLALHRTKLHVSLRAALCRMQASKFASGASPCFPIGLQASPSARYASRTSPCVALACMLHLQLCWLARFASPPARSLITCWLGGLEACRFRLQLAALLACRLHLECASPPARSLVSHGLACFASSSQPCWLASSHDSSCVCVVPTLASAGSLVLHQQ